MEKDNADCGPLLECTTSALGEEEMQMLLITTQQTNLSLCVKYAVERVLIGEARTSTGISWNISKDMRIKIQQNISLWFPHTKEFEQREWFLLELNPDNLLDGIQLDNSLERESLSLTSPQLWPLRNLTQTLQFGIALIIILEYSFFLLQECKHDSENVVKLAAAEYRTSQTQAAVEKAVKEVLQQDDGDDAKLGHMVIDIILRYRMSKVSLAERRK